MTEAFQLSACPSSVVEHWRLKPEMSWVRFPATASLYFHLNTYKLSLFQREARVLRMASVSECYGGMSPIPLSHVCLCEKGGHVLLLLLTVK